METQIHLTEWEANERAGLLAKELPEWRTNRFEAENPHTANVVLARFVNAIYKAPPHRAFSASARLLAEALASHPNISLPELALLFCLPCEFRAFDYTTFCARGFCKNPIASLLCLEAPDFWEQNKDMAVAANEVLCKAFLPLPVILQLKQHTNQTVAQSARLHIALAEETPTPREVRVATRSFLGAVDYAEFVAELHEENDVELLTWRGESPWWTQRLRATLFLELTTEPFSYDLYSRSPLQLLQHLAHDGNRFVRWAAQTRLADPDFKFTWHDGD